MLLQWRDRERMPSPQELMGATEWIIDNTDNQRTGLRILPLWFNDPRVGLDDWVFETATTLDHCDAAAWDQLIIGAPRRELSRHQADLSLIDSREPALETARWALFQGQPLHPDALLWDGWHSFDDVELTQVFPSGRRQRCDTWIDGALHCGGFHEWVYAAAGWRRMDVSHEACITATAPGRGRQWEMRWPDVPMAPSLRLRAGNVVFAARSERGTPMTISVELDGDEVHTQTFEIRDATYYDIDIETGRELGTSAELTIRLGTESGLDRYFCLRPQICTLGADERQPLGPSQR